MLGYFFGSVLFLIDATEIKQFIVTVHHRTNFTNIHDFKFGDINNLLFIFFNFDFFG